VCLPALVGGAGAGERLAEHLAQRYGMAVEPHLVDRYCLCGPPETCSARVREYVDAGARHVVFNLGCEPKDAIDQAGRLLAAVR
jgi:alkanesulfonate monooxygenase SsuD/methylene tetrahydromethanopterin reductase-like flavin-dependent oxidoreductase (luciferase family)